MLSVLIPIYNYRIEPLLAVIHKQLIAAEIPFEIIAVDDHSTKFSEENQVFANTLSHSAYHIAKQNGGIAVTRSKLCKLAKYHWAVLLDVDTLPVEDSFI